MNSDYDPPTKKQRLDNPLQSGSSGKRRHITAHPRQMATIIPDNIEYAPSSDMGGGMMRLREECDNLRLVLANTQADLENTRGDLQDLKNENTEYRRQLLNRPTMGSLRNTTTLLDMAKTELFQEKAAHQETKAKLLTSAETVRSLERQMKVLQLKTTKDSVVKEQGGRTTDAATAASTEKDASNAAARKPAISCEFDVLFYKRGFGFLFVSSEEKADPRKCSTYRNVRRHARETLKGHKDYAQVSMVNVRDWIYAGTGREGEEDTEWRSIDAGRFAEWFDLKEKASGASDLSHRVRVYMCDQRDQHAALAGLPKSEQHDQA